MGLLENIEVLYDEEAVVLQDESCRWTLSDLKSRVLHWRARMALPTGHTVALYGDNSLDWIAIDIACLEAGLILVPLPAFFSNEQLIHILDSTKPALLITDDTDRTDKLWSIVPAPVRGSAFSIARNQQAGLLSAPQGTSKITFTSGSTGEPRGVCLSAAHMIEQAQRLHQRAGLQGTLHLCVLPLSTLLENIAGVYAPMMAGGTVIVKSLAGLGFRGSSSVDSASLLNALNGIQPETMILIPQLLHLLTVAAANGWQPPPSLKFVAVGGACVAKSLVLFARKAGIPAFEGYGLSECGSVVTLNAPGMDIAGSTGTPLDGIIISVSGDEIVVSGSAMMGYLDDPGSWHLSEIYTGDLGDMDEAGFLTIRGREKNLLISSFGRNISPEWVEGEILLNPTLQDAIVFGDGRPFCVALLSCRVADVTDKSVDDWLESVNRKLPDYARIQAWHRLEKALSPADGLLTANGRPKRERIAAVYKSAIDDLYDVQAEPRIKQVS